MNTNKRLSSMLKVDLRRMFTTKLFYIMVGISIVIPILVLVMTTMMDGTVSVDPTTGVETVMEGFDNTWQSIATISGDSSESSEMAMSLTSMCNVNMLYFAVAVFVCIFIADDFRSGFSKTLFTGRSKKSEYVVSKSIVGFIGGAFMILGWLVGAIIGGAISGLSFDLGIAGVDGLVMCLISKILLMLIFLLIFVLVSVFAKQKLWLSIVGSLMVGMLFFTIVPMVSPLNSTLMNVLLCLVGGLLFSIGFGAISNKVLKSTDLV